MKKLVMTAMLVMGLGTYSAFAADLTVNVDPDTLNLQSQGNYVTVYVGYSDLQAVLDNAAILGAKYYDETPDLVLEEPIRPRKGGIEGGVAVLKFSRGAIQEICRLPQTTLILGWGGGEPETPIFDTAWIEGFEDGIILWAFDEYWFYSVDLTGAYYVNVGGLSGDVTLEIRISAGGQLVAGGTVYPNQLYPLPILGDYTNVQIAIAAYGGTGTESGILEGVSFTINDVGYGGSGIISGSDTIRVIDEGGKK